MMELKTPKADCGVIIARFQTPELTVAHRELIEFVRSRHPKFLIVLGVAPHTPSRLNPLDFATRSAMIQKEFPGTIVLPLYDENSDIVWSEKLDQLLKSIMPRERFALYGGRDSFIIHYKGTCASVGLTGEHQTSGTEIREAAFQNVLASGDFRSGVCYSVANQWPRVNPTVDIALLRDDGVFLGRKPNESLYRFIGGFVNGGESLEEAAIRETIEEAGINAVGSCYINYIGSSPIKDWRMQGTKDSILTSFFAIDYPNGPIQAGDDIAEIKFFKISAIYSNIIVPEHHILVEMLKYYLVYAKVKRVNTNA